MASLYLFWRTRILPVQLRSRFSNRWSSSDRQNMVTGIFLHGGDHVLSRPSKVIDFWYEKVT